MFYLVLFEFLKPLVNFMVAVNIFFVCVPTQINRGNKILPPRSNKQETLYKTHLVEDASFLLLRARANKETF